jgi:beta-glucanase (GH16 family)
MRYRHPARKRALGLAVKSPRLPLYKRIGLHLAAMLFLCCGAVSAISAATDWPALPHGPADLGFMDISSAWTVNDTPKDVDGDGVPDKPGQPTSKAKAKAAAAAAAAQKAANGTIAAVPAWQVDFSKYASGGFNVAGWHHDNDPEVPGYNDEAQAYTNNSLNNIFIENGKLVIAARKQQYTYPGTSKTYSYTSARIDTRNSFSFEYGKLEARIKMPKGKGVWPAWWFLSANQVHTNKLNPSAADWAQERFYMHDGELDAAEVYGQLPGLLEGTLYTFNKTYEKSTSVPDMAEVFHTYGVEVTPTKVVWSVDGHAYQTVTKPSDNTDDWPIGNGNKWYMILNVALGGSGGGNVIDDAMEASWRMEVENIKYFPFQ